MRKNKDSDRLELMTAELEDLKKCHGCFDIKHHISRAIGQLILAKTMMKVEEARHEYTT